MAWDTNNRRDLDETLGGLRAFREQAPDLTGSILGAVDRRRGLYSRRGLRALIVARWAVAAAAVVALAAVILVRQSEPVERALGVERGPVATVVEAVARDSARTARPRVFDLTAAFGDASASVSEQAATLRAMALRDSDPFIALSPPRCRGVRADKPAAAPSAIELPRWASEGSSVRYHGLTWPSPLTGPDADAVRADMIACSYTSVR